MGDETLALVLGGGGARAAYQVGVLAGITERSGCDVCFPIMTGVSAGAINTGFLACAQEPRTDAVSRLVDLWLGLSIPGVFDSGMLALTGSLLRWSWMLGSGGLTPRVRLRGILNTRPLHRTLTRFIEPAGIDANVAAGRLRAIAVSATSYGSGRTVTFVHGATDLPTWRRAGRWSIRSPIGADQVLASCALPLLFPAVQIGGRWYGDGSIRQTAPLAPAIHLGAGRILAVSLRVARPSEQREVEAQPPPPPAKVMGLLLNSLFLDSIEADAERLQRINRSLAFLAAERSHPEGLRNIDLVVLRPSKNLGALAVDLGGHLPRSLRILTRGMGSQSLESPDLLSYLLFERPYIERLLELGRADALAQWERIEPLLAGNPVSR